jgi:hypothetical protein
MFEDILQEVFSLKSLKSVSDKEKCREILLFFANKIGLQKLAQFDSFEIRKNVILILRGSSSKFYAYFYNIRSLAVA